MYKLRFDIVLQDQIFFFHLKVNENDNLISQNDRYYGNGYAEEHETP